MLLDLARLTHDSMRITWVVSLAMSLMASFASAQAPGVGVRDVSWVNASGAGTPILDARVHYPSAVGGVNAPLSPLAGGRPVVVFLHGYGWLGSDYWAIGDHLAQEGFIAVMLNTAQWDFVAMEHDGRAMFAALAAANGSTSSFFHHQLNMQKVGLMGHSMGGGVAAYVMFDVAGHPLANPGYECALSLAPVNPGAPAMSVRAPYGIVSGDGDLVTPPLQHSEPFYEMLSPVEGLKFHYHMDWGCDHMNLAGLSPAAPEVFDRTMAIATGFFGQFLGRGYNGLESVLGVDGLADSHLVQVDRQIVTPVIWCDAPLNVGNLSRITVVSENGYVGLLGAQSIAAPMATPLGELLLDPGTAFALAESLTATQRFDIYLAVPNDPLLVGATFAVQGAGATVASPFLLGSAMMFRMN
ncbi:MAG: hypothetical protein R3F29_07755 [Planctomycetota bacterium]